MVSRGGGFGQQLVPQSRLQGQRAVVRECRESSPILRCAALRWDGGASQERAGVRVGSVVLSVDGRNVRGGGVNATALAIKMARAGWGGPQPSGPVQIELLLRDDVAAESERAKLLAQESAAVVRIQAQQRGRRARREVSTALQQLEVLEQDDTAAQVAEHAASPLTSTSAETRELSLAEQA